MTKSGSQWKPLVPRPVPNPVTPQEQAKVGDLVQDMLAHLKAEETRDNPVRKRYWLFGGANFLQAQGGMKDFKGQFDKVEAAHEQAEKLLVDLKRPFSNPWAHILDSYTGEIGEVKSK